MADEVYSYEVLQGVLAGVRMRGTRFEEWDFEWSIDEMRHDDGELHGWCIYCSFERPSVDGGEMSRGLGRAWWIDEGSTRRAVVFTAWLAIRQIVDHELHESFTVCLDGEQVRLLDPHKSLEDLAVGSARVQSDNS